MRRCRQGIAQRSPQTLQQGLGQDQPGRPGPGTTATLLLHHLGKVVQLRDQERKQPLTHWDLEHVPCRVKTWTALTLVLCSSYWKNSRSTSSQCLPRCELVDLLFLKNRENVLTRFYKCLLNPSSKSVVLKPFHIKDPQSYMYLPADPHLKICCSRDPPPEAEIWDTKVCFKKYIHTFLDIFSRFFKMSAALRACISAIFHGLTHSPPWTCIYAKSNPTPRAHTVYTSCGHFSGLLCRSQDYKSQNTPGNDVIPLPNILV